MLKPLIGICCRLDRTPRGDRFYLQREYSEAVLAAGGIPVLLEPDSALARLGGAGEHLVNTSHHQAVERVAPVLRVSAHAPDGTIEAVEATEPGRFLVGVQWHPERIWKESDISRALFEELVRRAGK